MNQHGGQIDHHPVLQVIMERWRIQYQTTLGMNARIAALLAFTGIALGFLLKASVVRDQNPFALLGAAAFLISVVCLLEATRTRWTKELLPVREMSGTAPLAIAALVEDLITTNQVRLREKSYWLNAGRQLILAGTLLVTLAVLFDV